MVYMYLKFIPILHVMFRISCLIIILWYGSFWVGVIWNKMAGKLEVEDQQKVVRRENPAFAKLLDVLNNSLLQDGKPRETASRLKQVLCRN